MTIHAIDGKEFINEEDFLEYLEAQSKRYSVKSLTARDKRDARAFERVSNSYRRILKIYKRVLTKINGVREKATLDI